MDARFFPKQRRFGQTKSSSRTWANVGVHNGGQIAALGACFLADLMAEWSVGEPAMFELVFNPGSDEQERMKFTVSEGDVDDAIDYGRVESNEPFDKQMSGAAYHKVLELNVCNDVERITGEPWVVLHRGKIIARNVGAMGITEDDLV